MRKPTTTSSTGKTPAASALGSAYSRYGLASPTHHHAVYNRLTDMRTTSLRFEEVSHIVTIADSPRHPDYDELEVWGEREPMFQPANSDIHRQCIVVHPTSQTDPIIAL